MDTAVQKIEFSPRERATKTLLGLPAFAIVLTLIVLKSAHPILPFVYLVSGWYLYNLAYWKLYKRYVLCDRSPRRGRLYVGIIALQMLVALTLWLTLRAN